MTLSMGASGGGDFESAPPGTHKAICYKVLDLGTQKTVYNGEAKMQHKIVIGWELPESLMSDGRPHVIQNRYTLSGSPKGHLRPMIESWMGRKLTDDEAYNFNLKDLLGNACLISCIQDGEYVNVSAVMASTEKHDGTTHNDKQFLSLDPEDFDQEVLDKQGEKTKAAIMLSPEYMELKGTGKPTEAVYGNQGGKPAEDTDMPPTPPMEAYEDDDDFADENLPF